MRLEKTRRTALAALAALGVVLVLSGALCPARTVEARPGRGRGSGLAYRHAKHGSGKWLLDEQTLKPIGKAPQRGKLPDEIGRLESDWPGMQVRTAADLGQSEQPGVRYLLRWETLPSNRDRPYPGDHPPPGMLRVYRLRGDTRTF